METIDRVMVAQGQMDKAHKAHMEFLNRPGRTYSPQDSEENTRLLNAVYHSIEEFWKAFNQAASEDSPNR
jgi:hypothetical protein